MNSTVGQRSRGYSYLQVKKSMHLPPSGPNPVLKSIRLPIFIEIRDPVYLPYYFRKLHHKTSKSTGNPGF